MADNHDAIDLLRRARRRLVGAIALVVFIVIALPIVFDREPKPISQDLTIQIPSQDGGKFSSRVLPPQPEVKGDSKAGPAPSIGSTAGSTVQAAPAPAGKMDRTDKPDGSISGAGKAAAEPIPPSAKSETSKLDAPKQDAAKAASAAKAATSAAAPVAQSEQKAVAKADAAKPPQPEPAPAPAASGAESFVVPLGLYRNPNNVQKVRGWVTSAGFKSFTEAVRESNGVKVMAGPFPTREAAEKARDKLKTKGVDVGPVAAR